MAAPDSPTPPADPDSPTPPPPDTSRPEGDETAPQPLFGVDADRLTDAAEWIWQHREQLTDLVQRIPTLLDDAGRSIASAGDGAVSTADLLAGTKDRPGVSGLAESAGKVLAGCHRELAELNEQLAGLADQLDSINIPGVGKAFDVAAVRVRDGATRVSRVADGLADVATSMSSIGSGVGGAADGLRDLGTNLNASAGTLRGLLDSGAEVTSIGKLGGSA